jgi:hypothetical protein
MKPTVNLNGDRREELVRQLLAVRVALQAAMAVVGEAMPHGRNYPLNDGQYAIDRAEAEENIRVLRRMAEQYYHDAIKLSEELR